MPELTITSPTSATLWITSTLSVSAVPSEMPPMPLSACWAGKETGKCDDVLVSWNGCDAGMGTLAGNEVFSRPENDGNSYLEVEGTWERSGAFGGIGL